MMANAEQSQLVIVDVQERLCSVMSAEAMPAIIKHAEILLQAARLLNVPIVVSEQYPKGLGHTVEALMAHVTGDDVIEKTCFSCADSEHFNSKLSAGRPQIILAGMESHICVLQTALQLQSAGKQVFVVEDAVISRNPQNKANALYRLRHAGVIVTNTESVVFEWLKVAEGDAFKTISRLVR